MAEGCSRFLGLFPIRNKQIKLICTSFFALAMSFAVWSTEAGDVAPAWRGTDIDGREVVFPETDSGVTTVLVFWATWCPYCQAFMPNLAAIYEDYADRGVRIVAVNTKERGQGDPAAYMRDRGYPFVSVMDGDSIAEQYAVRFIPGLMIVDQNGKVIYRRKSTDLPAGRKIAEFWEGEVRAVLEKEL